ncbi:hypothetical protein AB0I34_17515 [Kribbella sp. NPDC050281]|uniref:hypothetical protein n=1 Tax=Kribbella sp. NPDC050281 TaxID=3155515 RepID=UPI0033E91597
MDADAKQRVKDALIAQAEAGLRSSQASVAEHDSAAMLDSDAADSVDDLSQSGEAADLGGLLDDVEARQKRILTHIKALDFGIKTAVAPGALVGFDGERYVVGVVAEAFECDGVTYEGLSSDSPIYASLKGLGLGDSFSFGSREHHVDFLA